MSDRSLRIALATLALAGASVSGYLVWVRYAGVEILCTTGGCATVQSSPYAKLLGVPVAVLGLAGFALIGATALSAAPLARAAGAATALTAFVFGSYLLVVQLTVIGAVCDWCVASDAITTLLAAAALLRLPERRPLEPAA